MKILKVALAVFIAILIAFAILPFIFKGKIIDQIKKATNEQVNANIAFSNDISIGIFSSFPNLNLGIKHLSVVGLNEFERDTLFSADEIKITLDILSVIKGSSICIRKIEMDRPSLYALILPNGKANWDIAKPTSDPNTSSESSTSPIQIKLKKVEMHDAQVHYQDLSLGFETLLKHANYTMKGDFADEVLRIENIIDKGTLSVWMNKIAYLNQVDASAEAAIDADMKAFKFTFSDNLFHLNQLELGMNGWVQMNGDDILMDMQMGVKKNDFKAFLSLIPALYAKDFDQIQSKGNLQFKGFAKGTYNSQSLPAFGIELGIENAWFKYPALAVPVENVNIALQIKNPDGKLNYTIIDLSRLHAEIDKEPLDARLHISNPNDPYIDLMAKGILDFSKVAKIVPLPEGTQLSGILNADILAKGKVKDVENKQFDNFDAQGNFTLNQLKYSSKDVKQNIEINQANVQVTPQALALKAFDANIGGSEMHANGVIENYLSYAFNKGTLSGNVNFSSPFIDANKMLGISSDTSTNKENSDTTSTQAPDVPERIRFNLVSNISKLNYTNLSIENFVGSIRIDKNTIHFENIALKTLGSAIKMNGYYLKQVRSNPEMDMHFNLQDLDIPLACKTFISIKKLAPAAEKMNGKFDMDFNMQSQLTNQLKPVFEKLQATGKLKLKNSSISRIEVLNKLAEAFHRPDLKELSMNDVAIAFEVKDGRVYTKPFEIKAAGKTITMSGSSGLDQTIDYSGKTMVSRSELGSAGESMNQLMSQFNSMAGTKVKLSEQIAVGFNIKGSFTKPEITTNLGDVAKSEGNSLKNQLQDELNAKKKELEDATKAKAEQLKKEAEDKARVEADRIKKEAEDRLKNEANNLKKKAEEEAKNRLKGLFKP